MPINRDYTFYADPFILKINFGGSLRKKSGKGKILCLDPENGKIVCNFSDQLKITKHLSYPYIIKHKGTLSTQKQVILKMQNLLI